MGDEVPFIDGDFSQGGPVFPEYYQDKYLVVVFWAMGDPKSAEWEAKLREIRKTYSRNKDLQMLSVCVEADRDKWMKYLDDAAPLEDDGEKVQIFRDRLWWQTQVHPEGWTASREMVDKEHLPGAYLVGTQGKFLAVRIPLADLESTMKANVKPKQP